MDMLEVEMRNNLPTVIKEVFGRAENRKQPPDYQPHDLATRPSLFRK